MFPSFSMFFQMWVFLCIVAFTCAFQNDAEEASNKVLNAYMNEKEEEKDPMGKWIWDWFQGDTLSKHVYSYTWKRNHPYNNRGGGGEEVYPTFWIEGLWFLVIGSMLFLCVRVWVFGTVTKIWSVLVSVVTFGVIMTKFYRLYY